MSQTCRRDDCDKPHPRCIAHIKSGDRKGEPCMMWPERGGTTCRKHGGARAVARNAAARNRQRDEALAAASLFGAPIDVDPSQALLDLVHWTAGEVAYWRGRVRLIEEKDLTWGKTKKVSGGPMAGTTREAAPNIAYVMLTESSNRLATYATAALKAGVEERRVQLAESHGLLVAGVIQRILGQLELTPVQQALIPDVVPRELRALSA